MPDEITWPTWLLVLVGIGAAAGAATAIILLLKQTGRGVKTASTWVAGIVRREVSEIVEAKLASAIGQVLAEVTPNGGSSMRDAVTRLEATLRELKADHGAVSTLIREHIEHSATDIADLRHWLERLDPGRAERRLPLVDPDGADGAT